MRLSIDMSTSWSSKFDFLIIFVLSRMPHQNRPEEVVDSKLQAMRAADTTSFVT
jgi:hypothetical protein